MERLPPSGKVRKVKRRTVSPRMLRRFLRISVAFLISGFPSESRIPFSQSALHSTTSAGTAESARAESSISFGVVPTMGTQIFGIPSPRIRFLIFSGFICLLLLSLIQSFVCHLPRLFARKQFPAAAWLHRPRRGGTDILSAALTQTAAGREGRLPAQ